MRFVADWADCMAQIECLLSSSEPCFLSRIGGSDTNAVAAMLEARASGHSDYTPHVLAHMPIVQKYNGYYDLSGNPSSYIRYLETLESCYKRSNHLFVCNYQLLSMYLRDTLHPSFYREDIEGRQGFELLIGAISDARPGCTAYPYQFVEKMVSHPYTLFNVFSRVLQGRKVLVIGPFADSIRANFHRRHSFFKQYAYPEFTLSVCQTPITYSGLSSEFYPADNWFATTAALQKEVAAFDFDLALLSCGSYALPLGEYITTQLGRTAVYVGGILQLFFGVMGRRYAGNSFFEEQINSEFFIRPLEAERYLQNVPITPEMAREAFGAYF